MEQNIKDLREGLLGFLSTEIVTISFLKTNGEQRKMKCTLNPKFIENNYEKKTERTKKENDEVIAVWDCDKQAWRSFRVDSVKSFSFSLE